MKSTREIIDIIKHSYHAAPTTFNNIDTHNMDGIALLTMKGITDSFDKSIFKDQDFRASDSALIKFDIDNSTYIGAWAEIYKWSKHQAKNPENGGLIQINHTVVYEHLGGITNSELYTNKSDMYLYTVVTTPQLYAIVTTPASRIPVKTTEGSFIIAMQFKAIDLYSITPLLNAMNHCATDINYEENGYDLNQIANNMLFKIMNYRNSHSDLNITVCGVFFNLELWKKRE